MNERFPPDIFDEAQAYQLYRHTEGEFTFRFGVSRRVGYFVACLYKRDRFWPVLQRSLALDRDFERLSNDLREICEPGIGKEGVSKFLEGLWMSPHMRVGYG